MGHRTRSNDIIPVGDSVQLHLKHWEQLDLPPALLQVLRIGYLLPFCHLILPPLTATPLIVQTQDSAEMKLQIEKLLQLAAIEPVSSPMEPGFFSRIFLVPKSSGGYRPVIDLSALNLYLDVPKFKMETIHSIIPALEESQWAITVDLQNAYFHVPIHKDARKFLRFTVRDQVFQFRALPFGLAAAPFVFSWFLRPFVKFL